MPTQFDRVRDILTKDQTQNFGNKVVISHPDVTCDGCETEPIIGQRWKCTVCDDIDLCGACIRALIAGRIKMAQDAGPMESPTQESRRPKQWIAKLRSDDKTKWGALQTAVPCLHPSHRFVNVVFGPEREVVYSFTPNAESESDQDAAAGAGAGGGHLQEFLETFPPSECSCGDVAAVILDSTGNYATRKATDRKNIEEQVDKALEDWEKLIAKQRPTPADVDAIARKRGLLQGKWLCFPRTSEVDAAWRAAAGAAMQGTLPCCQIKISSVAPKDDRHVMMCYTTNYQDSEQVMAAARALCGVLPVMHDQRLLYKPDIYSYLGIYSGNEYGLKPTVHQCLQQELQAAATN